LLAFERLAVDHPARRHLGADRGNRLIAELAGGGRGRGEDGSEGGQKAGFRPVQGFGGRHESRSFFQGYAERKEPCGAAKVNAPRLLARLETRDPENIVERQPGIAPEIHPLTGEIRLHLWPRGESLPGLVGLWNVDGDRFTDGVIAERVEQRLDDLRMFGKER